MASLEQVVRPFQSPVSGPVPFTQPGTVGVPRVHMIIGSPASLPKTVGVSYSNTVSTYLQAVNPESVPSNGWPGG